MPSTENAYEPVLRRTKEARRAVLVADRVADWTITVGGILVIIAVFGILVFLVEEVMPLFQRGSLTAQTDYRLNAPVDRPAALTIDEHHSMAVLLSSDGEIRAFHAATGAPLQVKGFDFQGKRVTAVGLAQDRESVAFGMEDGTVRFGRLQIKTQVLPADGAPANLEALNPRDSIDGSAIYSRIAGNQIRKVTLDTVLQEETRILKREAPIIALDYRLGGLAERPTRAFVTISRDGEIKLNLAESKVNLLTREVTVTVTSAALPALPQGVQPSRVLMTQKADQVFIADKSGRLFRYNTQNMNQPALAEQVNLLPAGVELSALGFLAGESSLVVGGTDGSVNIFFRLARDGSPNEDGFAMVRTREFQKHQTAVRNFQPTQRDKTFLTADADGRILVRHGTAESTLLDLSSPNGGYAALAFAPRGDGILAVRPNGQATLWELSIPHPETSLHTLFGKVWYESYPEPTYTWQSSAATDDFEPKLSIIPLIFGTIKATVYSLIFAIPIALLGAIYTSEFMHHKVRAMVKPLMEMMASLPSVVLGFVAALVLAPVVETWIAAVLLAFFLFPLCLIGAAYLWQFLPSRIALRLQGIPKFFLILVAAGLGIMLAYRLGPVFERVFFAGNFTLWVNGSLGSAEPFLFLILLPAMFLLASMAGSRLYGNQLKHKLRRLTPFQAALLSLAHWIMQGLLAASLSFALASVLSRVGFDARGTFIDTYVQRNTLVVGFAMGFAVIPIIYTLAEDALNAVPEHLRAASLGCGATPWQTAVWVVLPTAVSGVFSAIMIGMGRAVGETMIVVMATGNTPIIDWNLFNGLRALSANIAVELPEAVKDGTLYRVLFLTGLILFAMTFVINTLAEIIRQRFRKRALQL
jgi:phosphate transport system permease protein